MSGAALAIGPVAVGGAAGTLAVTGAPIAGYFLVGLAMLIAGLLLLRVGQARAGGPGISRPRGRALSALLVSGVAALGVGLIVFAGWWRGIEAAASANTIHLVTGRGATVAGGAGVVALHHGVQVSSVFALTSECSVAYIAGSLLIGGAPLLLLRRLSALRIAGALLLAVAVLEAVNVIRLTAIGAAVSYWGETGFAVAHTYLGTLLTFVGTCLAGAAAAFVLVAHGRRPSAAGPRDVAPCA